jgi:hypothetical protein
MYKRFGKIFELKWNEKRTIARIFLFIAIEGKQV